MPESGARYARWGKVFRVEQVPETGRWACMGRAAGHPAYYLDRIGTFGDEGAAQGALDAWAKRNGLTRVAAAGGGTVGTLPQAEPAPAGYVKARQAMLWESMGMP